MSDEPDREKRHVAFVSADGGSPSSVLLRAIEWAEGGAAYCRDRAEIVDHYIVQEDTKINGTPVAKGSFVVTAKVFDDHIWRDIKAGKIDSASITIPIRTRAPRPPWWHFRYWAKRAWRWIWRTP